MNTTKTLVTILVSVASTYAALTAWPALRELSAPSNVPAQSASPASPQTGLAPLSTPPPVARPARAVAPASHRSPGIDIGAPPVSIGAWDGRRVKYARAAVVIRSRPGGVPVIAASINKAPLTVLTGTRLLPREEKGEWVMVEAPSAQLGWVRASELTAIRPQLSDEHPWRY